MKTRSIWNAGPNPNEKFFVHHSMSEADRKLFGFGDDVIIEVEDDWLLAHVMFFAGLFASVSEARKNGFNKPIPSGLSNFTVGKNKTKVFILNTIDGDD
mgnify:CR=1 FL=1|tara:strand:- start:725 stop:1021 length:297 start_codon:yes stop_codon:yes gene_type:complete